MRPAAIGLAAVLWLAVGHAAWSAEEAATPAPAAPQKAALTPDEVYSRWLKDVRLIEINYLRGGDEKQWQAGRVPLFLPIYRGFSPSEGTSGASPAWRRAATT